MSVYVQKLRTLLDSFEQGELYPDSDESMRDLLRLVKEAREAGYFLHLQAHVQLFVQTVDATFTPVVAVTVATHTQVIWTDADMDQIIDTETFGAEQAEATLKNILGIATTTLNDFLGRWIRLDAVQ